MVLPVRDSVSHPNPRLGRVGALPSLRALRQRERHLAEIMDRPDCDPDLLHTTYARFGAVNTVVSRWHRTYVRLIRPMLDAGRVTTVLDVGCGSGDLDVALLRWARRDGFRVEVTGVDPDPRANAFALSRPPQDGLTFRQGYSSDLVGEGESFDFVISNHMLHHLDCEEFAGLLRDSEALARRRVVHSDIERHPLGYVLFGLGALSVAPGSYIRADGLTSIRRSYTMPELKAAAPEGWRVLRQIPFCQLLVWDAGLSSVGDVDDEAQLVAAGAMTMAGTATVAG